MLRLATASSLLFNRIVRCSSSKNVRPGIVSSELFPHSQHHPSSHVTASFRTMPLIYDSDPIVYGPRSGKSTATVIMLHGLGDTGDGWEDAALMLQSVPSLQHTKWILPTAPRRPITLNNGYVMTGWYDIPSLEDIADNEDAEGLRGSQQYIESLITKEEASGTPSHRIVVAGFSQGGAVSLMMLRSKKKLAAVVGLSTYLPLHKEDVLVSEENKETPVFMAHGTADQVVLFEFGNRSKERLEKLGSEVTWMPLHGMGHSATQAELQALAQFLTSVVPAQ